MAAKDRCQFCDDKLRTSTDREAKACGACRGTDWFIHKKWETMLAFLKRK